MHTFKNKYKHSQDLEIRSSYALSCAPSCRTFNLTMAVMQHFIGLIRFPEALLFDTHLEVVDCRLLPCRNPN
jgi:hypothetical protein